MKRVFFMVLIVSTVLSASAKKRIIAPETPQKVKTTDHYIGVQANFLLREFFNFGGTSFAPVNPFGFVYHINNRRSGAGIRIGLGPSIYNTTNIDGLATIKSKGHDVSARLGFDKRFTIDNRWEAGFGIDAVFNTAKDETKNDQMNSQGFISETSSLSTSYGGGPMGYLRYKLRPNILLGTETSLYYLTGKNENRTAIISSGQVVSESDDNDKFSQGQLNLPVSLYLLIKF